MKKIAALITLILVAIWFACDRFASHDSSPSSPPAVAAASPAPKPVAAKPQTPPPEQTAPVLTQSLSAAPAESAPAPQISTGPQAITYPQMTLSEVVTGNVFHDGVFGVSAILPEGWSVARAIRWGQNNRENTVFFQAPDGSRAIPSMYYQKYPNGAPTGMSPEAYLRDLAVKKEASRQKDGFPEYQNDPGSMVYREVGGHPSLSYSATYISKNGEVHAEYFTRILGPGGYVMFFVKGPVADVQKVIPSVYDMSGTVTTP